MIARTCQALADQGHRVTLAVFAPFIAADCVPVDHEGIEVSALPLARAGVKSWLQIIS